MVKSLTQVCLFIFLLNFGPFLALELSTLCQFKNKPFSLLVQIIHFIYSGITHISDASVRLRTRTLNSSAGPSRFTRYMP